VIDPLDTTLQVRKADMIYFLGKRTLLTIAVTTLVLASADDLRAQKQSEQAGMAVVQAGINHTRSEFQDRGPLFLDLENQSFKPFDASAETSLASRIGAQVRRMQNAFQCVPSEDGDAICSGNGVILTPSTPIVEGDSATVLLHYLFVNHHGGIASVSIKLLLERSGGHWRVVREIGREIT
jgi:hypothetical protein